VIPLLAMTVVSYTGLAIAPVAPLLREDIGLSRAQVGAMVGLIYLAAAMTSVSGGRLTDRFGAPWVLAGSLTLSGVGLAIAATAGGVGQFVAGMACVGAGYGCVNPPTDVVVAHAATERNRGLLLSVKQSGVTAGGIVAGASLPTLAQAFGWRSALLVPASACIVLAVVSLVVRRALTVPRAAAVDAPAPPAEPGGRRTRWELRAGLYGFAMAGLQLAFATYLAVYLTEVRGFGLTAGGAALATAMVAGTVGRIIWGAVSDRVFPGRRHAGLQLCAALGSLALLGLTLAPTGPLLWVCIALAGLTIAGWNGVFIALIAEHASPNQIGRAVGRALRPLYAGVVVVPPCVGLLADRLGWGVSWVVAAGGAGLAVLLLAPPSVPRDQT
jgi:sugar phosphate permease